jgi:hypothetical protein
MKILRAFLLGCLLTLPASFCARTNGAPDQAHALALEVWKAAGGENWDKVRALDFTFVVEDNGKTVASATHHWDVKSGTDHVQWKGKDVTVNVHTPAADEASKAAYGRWVNDSYWLLAPLKACDRGVHLKYEGRKDVEGQPREMLRLSFDQIGLTPNDQYVLYIDPTTKLVQAWDYIPQPDKVMHGTWEKYETFGGLKLATEHHFAGKVIRFTGVKAELGP